MAGFVLSLVGFLSCGFLSPLAVIFSAVAMRKAPRGLAIAGLVLGILGSWWVVLGGGLMLVIAALGIGAAADSEEGPPERVVDVGAEISGIEEQQPDPGAGSRTIDPPQGSPPEPPEPEPHDPKALPVPFSANFVGIPEGEVPEGWSADDLVAVRREGESRWLQYSGKLTGIARTPKLTIPQEFELEVYTWNDNGLTTTLLTPSGEPIDVFVSCGPYRWTFCGERVDFDFPPYAPCRFRLVRQGQMIRFIAGERVYGEKIIPAHVTIGQIEFGLSGGSAPAALAGFTIRSLADAVPADAPDTWSGDFTDTEIGRLPKEWEGSSAVGLRAVEGLKVLSPSKEGLYRIATPILDISGDWTLSVAAEVPSDYWKAGEFQVILEGAKNTPDLKLRLYRDHIGTASFTSAANVARKIVSARPFRSSQADRFGYDIQIQHDGVLYTVTINGVVFFAQRMPDFAQFRRVSFILDSGSESSHLLGVRLLRGIQTVKPNLTEVAPSNVTLPEAADSAGDPPVGRAGGTEMYTTDDLSGVWKTMNGTELRLLDRGDTIHVSLVKSPLYKGVDGLLAQDGMKLKADRWRVDHREFGPRALKMEMEIIDASTIKFRTEKLSRGPGGGIDRNFNDTGMLRR